MPLLKDPFIRPKDLRAVTGLSRTSIYRMMERGEFPRPMQLSPGAVGWPHSWIAEWRSNPPGWKAKHEEGRTLDCREMADV
jgi:prophage regulatory protein